MQCCMSWIGDESLHWECNGRYERAYELSAANYRDVGLWPLAPSFVARYERYFFSSFELELEVQEKIASAKSQREPWQEIFSTEDRTREVIGKMINIQIFRRILNQSLSGVCKTRTRGANEALFELLNYKTLLSRSMAIYAEEIERTGKKIGVVQ